MLRRRGVVVLATPPAWRVVTAQLGDNVGAAWDSYLTTASANWSTSIVLDTTVVAGQSSNKRCSATSGRDEVCASTYGKHGWLGLATISVTGGTHITQGTVKLNDTYFNQAAYNNSNERHHADDDQVRDAGLEPRRRALQDRTPRQPPRVDHHGVLLRRLPAEHVHRLGLTRPSKHQVTIAKRPFEQAGFRAGEVVAVRALGPGRVELASLDALFDKHRGRLRTGGEFRRIVDELHASGAAADATVTPVRRIPAGPLRDVCPAGLRRVA